MRITNNYIFNTAEENISSGYSAVATLQEEISTGIRLSQSSVDPLGESQMVMLQSRLSSIKQSGINANIAETELTTEQSQLNNLSGVIQSIVTTVQKLSNGTNSAQDYKDASTKVAEYLNQVISIANSKNQSNDSIFAGTNLSQDAYTVTKNGSGNITGVTYNGNDSQQDVPLSSGVTVKIYQSGNTIFNVDDPTNTGTSISIFTDLINLAAQLKTGSFSATQAQDELKRLTAFQNQNTTVLSNTTNQYQFADFEVSTLNSLKANYSTELRNVRDADYSTVVSELSQKTTLLKAAMSASLELEKLNLFDQQG